MRGCLLFVVGVLVGAALLLLWWPRTSIPHGVTAPQKADIQIRISDAYLAREVQNHVSNINVPSVNNVRISSIPPASLRMDADLSVGPVSAPATLQLQPEAANGTVDVRLISSDVAGLPVPPQLTGFVADAINRRLAGVQGNATHVVGVHVFPSGLEILANST